MSATPYPGFATLQFSPSWEATYTVEFANYSAPLGNGYELIQLGGTPMETAQISRVRKNGVVTPILTDMLNTGGTDPINWRLDNQVGYKLWWVNNIKVVQLGIAHSEISAELIRHADPQYAILPAIATRTPPWGVLPSPILWGSETEYELDYTEVAYGVGGVKHRNSPSAFIEQNRKQIRKIQLSDRRGSTSNFTNVYNFLMARRGQIPFKLSTDGTSTPAKAIAGLWVCPRFTWRKIGARKRNPAAMSGQGVYTFDLELRQVFRRG